MPGVSLQEGRFTAGDLDLIKRSARVVTEAVDKMKRRS